MYADIGSIYPERNYINVYGVYRKNPWWFVVEINGGSIQSESGENFKTWYSGSASIHYSWNSAFATACRGETFSDPGQSVIQVLSQNSFIASSFSLNFDCMISNALMFRAEIKQFFSEYPIFNNYGIYQTSQRLILGLSGILKLDAVLYR